MFKFLAFTINIITLIFFNFLLEDVTVDQSLPDRVEVGNTFVVTVSIDKSTIEGYAKYQVVLPPGVEATEIKTGVAKFNFDANKAKFVWMTLPSERTFEISYKVTVTDSSLKEIPIGGTFSYLDENQRMTIDVPARIVKMGKEEIYIPVIPEAEVSITRSIKNISGHRYLVSFNINYKNVTGFAKIQDVIPSGADVKPDVASDAVFSTLNKKVKFVWMNFPEDKTNIKVSYFIDLENASSKKISDVSGEFAFIHDGESRKIQIENPSTIELADIETPVIAVVAPTEVKTPEPVKTKTPVKDIPVTSIPAPENGVLYKVQIMAAHKSVNVKTFFDKKFKFTGKVIMDSHDGWFKYITGDFNKYKGARDLRNDYRSDYSFPGPFVVAYNNGKRITVQEALMISNQKWVN